MRFVADESFPGPSLRLLLAQGHELSMAPLGAHDAAVLAYANAQDAVLLTMDRDFGQLIYGNKLAAVGVVLFRNTLAHPEQAGQLLLNCVQTSSISLVGKFTVITPEHLRQRDIIK